MIDIGHNPAPGTANFNQVAPQPTLYYPPPDDTNRNVFYNSNQIGDPQATLYYQPQNNILPPPPPPPAYPGGSTGFCPQCGALRSDPRARFCSSCGQTFNKY